MLPPLAQVAADMSCALEKLQALDAQFLAGRELTPEEATRALELALTQKMEAIRAREA